MCEELKPVKCGCGGEAKVETDHDTFVPGEPIDWKRVRCSECNIRTTWRSTETEAITAWNRAMSGSAEEKLKSFWNGMSAEMKEERKKGHWTGDCCSCCGVSKYNYIKMVDDECGPFGTWNFCPHCGADMRGDR